MDPTEWLGTPCKVSAQIQLSELVRSNSSHLNSMSFDDGRKYDEYSKRKINLKFDLDAAVPAWAF